MDGSCARHVVRELSRAAYAWVFLGPTGPIVACAQGTVLDVPQQTPQAAEHQSMALVLLFVERSGDRYSDSATVTKLCNTPVQHQIPSRHRYAGMR
eukprot:6948975-Pyramimonas_sp.AAC.1